MKNQRALIGGVLLWLGTLGSCPGYVLWSPIATWSCNQRIYMKLQLGATSDADAEAALQIWNQNLYRVRFTSSRATGTGAGGDSINEIFWRSPAVDPSMGDALAMTRRWRVGSTITEMDVMVNADLPWGSYRDSLYNHVSFDLQRVLVHECGHVLGLDHPDVHGQNVSAIMNSTISDIIYPTADDLAGIHALYPREYTPPSVAITAPAQGTLVYSSRAVLQGTAADNCTVDRVQFKVNNEAEFHPASGATAWSATAWLQPGTNYIRVVSVDTSGNQSAAAWRTVVYVVKVPVVVQTNGFCPPVPARHPLLAVGRTATLTASAYPGYRFLNWTDGSGTVLTTSPNLLVKVQPNLVFQANYQDVKRPAVTIKVPAPGARLSNEVLLVRGRAVDTGCVAQVFYQLDGGAWAGAAGTTNWQASVILAPGTNVLRACGVDAAGNWSVTNKVSCFYVVPHALTLVTNGLGTITRNFSGSLLELGRSYTVTAVPGAGQVFSNWAGGCVSTNPVLTFLMQPDLVLQANFTPNPFLPRQGSYYGLFYPTNEPAVTNSGYFTLKLTDRGTFTGRVLLAGTTQNFSGGFSLDGQARVMAPRPGGGALVMDLGLVPCATGIDGWITDGAWLAPLTSERATASAAHAGRYTLVIGGAADGLASPAGYGAGAMILSATGTVQVAGTLADGSPFSQQTGASELGEWPLYLPLYGGRGVMMGWMGLDREAPALWLKPCRPGNLYYANGFQEVRPVAVARYTAPAAGRGVLDWTNGIVSIGGGNLPQTFLHHVRLTTNKVYVLDGGLSHLVFSLTRSNGLFSGSFRHPVTGLTNSFKGAVIQSPTDLISLPGAGWFLGQDQSGFVTLEPAEAAPVNVPLPPTPFIPEPGVPPVPPLPDPPSNGAVAPDDATGEDLPGGPGVE